MISSKIETPKFSLDALPLAIEQNVCRLAHLDREIFEAKQAIAAIEAEVGASVFFDPDLKNEEQRKVRKAEMLLAHQGYQNVNEAMQDAILQRAECTALVERLRSEMYILKLEIKLAIATRMGADAVDLLGVQ